MKILIASSIDTGAVKILEKEHKVKCMFGAPEDELVDSIADVDILVFRSGVQITRKVLEAAQNLKLILRAGSGVDNVDLAYVNEREIPFIRVPGPGAKAVAEMAFALMLAVSRNVLVADRLWRQGHWVKQQMTGYTLRGKTLGIVGCGNIGSEVGKLGAAWGMNVMGCVEMASDEYRFELAAKGIDLVDFNEVLENSDYISVHVPLQPSTRGLIDAAALAKVRPGAFLINLARGGVVDEKALYNALISGGLRGAGIDVHAEEGEGKISPFAELDNVVLTPHIGASSFDAQREIGEIIVDSVQSFMQSAHKVA